MRVRRLGKLGRRRRVRLGRIPMPAYRQLRGRLRGRQECGAFEFRRPDFGPMDLMEAL